ncbi:hypothetical protein [Hymenobacter bucti]|uniref:Uncharacterized protein n=1 Tax=Hymenobacter bucti TaxID=1844114 RepID=A0ABW4QYU6_9BACT
MTSLNTSTAEEPILAEERRDNRIVALVMSATVLVSLVLLYAH